jgi:YidC/Oxa1 family membrane protein insertase
MFASIFQVIIVKPIFNLLVAIYAVLPGHNFGLALILFTIVIRLLMWPLVKKQLHQAKAMRHLQPEIKKIKAAAKGNRQEESKMLMELYKEKDISPFGSIGTLVIQFIVLIGLYSGLREVVTKPSVIISSSYSWLTGLSWMKQLAGNIHLFDGCGCSFWFVLVLVPLLSVANYRYRRSYQTGMHEVVCDDVIVMGSLNGSHEEWDGEVNTQAP